MKLRAFVSIDIPETVKKEIRLIQKKLPKFLGKLTEPENLHLTLKFLGWVDEEQIGEIKKQLRKIKFNSFDAEIKQIGFFYPRIVWLNLTNADELQKRIDDALSSLFEKERRFMGHLTIARVKKVDDWKKFLAGLRKIKIKKIPFIIKNFRLKKSILRRSGPIYEAIEEYALD